MQPSLFLAHGSPMNLIEHTSFSVWFEQFAQMYHTRFSTPRAVIVLSSHWITPGHTFITSDTRPPQIYDFYNFPKELYAIPYAPTGDAWLSEQVQKLLLPHPFSKESQVELHPHHGFDHAVWAPLLTLFPGANIPVVALSMDPLLPLASFETLGRALGALREENVLIIGSGNIVHNLYEASFAIESIPHAVSVRFEEAFKQALESESLTSIATHPLLSWAAPSIDHIAPSFFAFGAKKMHEKVRILTEWIQNKTVSMLSFGYGISTT